MHFGGITLLDRPKQLTKEASLLYFPIDTIDDKASPGVCCAFDEPLIDSLLPKYRP